MAFFLSQNGDKAVNMVDVTFLHTVTSGAETVVVAHLRNGTTHEMGRYPTAEDAKDAMKIAAASIGGVE